MKFISVLTAALMVFLPFFALSIPAAAAEADVPLSPGLEVIAARCALDISIAPGDEVTLYREDLAHAVGSIPNGITLVSRPDSTVGQLICGSLAVPAGQYFSASDLDARGISFVPTDSAGEGAKTEFTFRSGSSPLVYTCRITLTEAAKTNSAPRLDCATSAALSAVTYVGRLCGGRLSGMDPDGDGLTFEIVKYASHGTLTLTDASAGTYLYQPDPSFSGKDSFTYTVKDSFGKYADGKGCATVTVSVSRYSTSVDYADMSGAEECAALTVTAAGLMNGTKLDSGYYFNPDMTVSRAEFLVMVMSAAGIGSLPKADKTVFADDDAILPSMKPYVAAAYELGFTDGWIVDGKQCFCPSEPITVAEAAVLTAAVLGIPTDDAVPVSADWDTGSPNWAKDAVTVLTAGGFSLTGLSDERITAGKLLDRKAAAVLLCAVLRCS